METISAIIDFAFKLLETLTNLITNAITFIVDIGGVWWGAAAIVLIYIVTRKYK